ncbi:hypothetical protein ThidrDRAFT_3955 [Thiorhodococcus drewsii AZ1]|uniref:Right handed beta helix domain-containing protein n=1 Tax=Thiorhodococcus drewsii AZ1 TaxID=765913 RepID=G2E6P2_9GAMM|nr:right-handed parallel beta-helix repeat-containing protein [Thiorhodococcus drewsii]EGV28252.1 hypothetical protein ThidrDRAFT_3955 [Thiorhodococcus drewsii AZ1]
MMNDRWLSAKILTLMVALPLVAAPAWAVDAASIIPAYDAHLDAVQAPEGFGTGQVWRVGPSQRYKKPSEVASLVQDGDVVEIEAATYACDTGVKWSANFLTLVGVGGRPVLDATDCSIPGGKGIWNPTKAAQNLIVDNIAFVGASVSDRNGAGIRFDGGGYLYITNSYFSDNENGVLITPASPNMADVVIDRSEFSHNGVSGGRTHNMYISGNVSSFVLRFSYSHDSHIGHLVKTRALKSYILYNRLADEVDGDSSYNIDVPQGGLTYIIGNIIQQGPNSPNYGMVSYSAESNPHPEQRLFVSGNTFVNDGKATATALKLYDKGLSDALLVNNLFVDIAADRVVSGAFSLATLDNNLVTDAPGFFDRSNRVYVLTASSGAMDAGVDAGDYGGFSLSPVYQYQFPRSGRARPVLGALDIGAKEYDPSEIPPLVPTLSFYADSELIDYETSAVLNWSAAYVDECQASAGWSGALEASGTFTSEPLTSNDRFEITCIGPGGSVSQSISITVNDSDAAEALGLYIWEAVPDSRINDVCAARLKGADGSYVYKDNFGTGPYCESKGGYASGVYVPELGKWYLMGGGGGRNYYGNEVYAFDFETQQAERITDPTHISETKEYTPDDIYGSKIHTDGCHGILHLKRGGIAPAPRGISGTASYNPVTKTIIVGPSGIVRGHGDCSSKPAHSQYGQNVTDIWSFDPFTKRWTLLAGENDQYGSVTIATWLLDPATGIGYTASNRNGSSRGGYLIDFSHSSPRNALVDNVWPFQVSRGPVSIDTVNGFALQLGVSGARTAVFDLNGLSLEAYGTSGAKGSTGVVGGAGPLFEPDTSWTFTGNTSLLSVSDLALTYNPNLNKFVAWTGDDALYFITPDYSSKVLEIVSKHVSGNPPKPGNLRGKFTYIPDRDLYIAFSGTDKDFYYLRPTSKIPVPESGSSVVPRARSLNR